MGWDPTIFIAFGDTAIPTTDFAQARLGERLSPTGQGHDGKYFFVQAHDPLLLSPAEHAVVLDRPLYRSQRMLYPVLGGRRWTLESTRIMWGCLVVNVLAWRAGTFATSMVAQRMGGSAWWGLAFAFNIGLISEINISGAGVACSCLRLRGGGCVPHRAGGMGDRLGGLAVVIPGGHVAGAARDRLVVVASWTEAAIRVAIVAGPHCVRRSRGRSICGYDSVGHLEPGDAGLAFEPPFVGLVKGGSRRGSRRRSIWRRVSRVVLLGTYFVPNLQIERSRRLGLRRVCPVDLGPEREGVGYFFDSTRAVAPMITAFVLMVFLRTRGLHRSCRGREIRHRPTHDPSLGKARILVGRLVGIRIGIALLSRASSAQPDRQPIPRLRRIWRRVGRDQRIRRGEARP